VTCRLTSPANGTTITAGAPLALRAATTGTGITRVLFRIHDPRENSDTDIYDTTAPYEASYTPAKPGPYFVAAWAFKGSTFVPSEAIHSRFTATASWRAWREQHFTAAELTQPTVSGELADPAARGLKNLHAFRLRTRPARERGRAPAADWERNQRWDPVADVHLLAPVPAPAGGCLHSAVC
jgi:hypothetical protein